MCILGNEAEPKAPDLPFPEARPPLENLFWCEGGRSSSVPAVMKRCHIACMLQRMAKKIEPEEEGGGNISQVHAHAQMIYSSY